MTQRLFALSPDTIFAARVNEPGGITYPTSSVEFDTVTTGAYTDIPVGATVLFGSTAGADDLGRKRIRAAADSTTLYIGRGSRGKHDGEFNISDNDFITVINTRSVWSKIPNISGGSVVKDEITYTDQNENIYPKANIEGGWRAATISSGTSLATFQFIGTASYANSGTISTYLWNVGSGTITVGTSASNTITATFAAGYHWVKLTVTDSNGKTHAMEVLVYARNPAADDCIAFECVEHQITQQGQTAAFRILEDVPESTHPDGMPVIFWEGEPSSASDYSNVKFWGWHQTDDNSVTAERTGTLKDTILNCLDLAGRLDTLPGFPQSLTRDATPASWLEMAGLDLPLLMDYLLRWHSSAFELGYYTSAAGSGYDIPIIGSDGESLFNQAAKMAAAMIPDHILTSDRHGALRVLHDPQFQNTADRTATSQAAITSSNILAISWQRQRPPRIHWNWPYAIVASASEVDYVSSRAPGEAPGQGLSSNEVNYKLAKSQDDLNDCAGHRYAYLNSFHGQIAVAMATDLGIDPADMTWVTLTLASSYHRRQIGFSSARCLPVEVNISYDYQPTGTVKTVELLLEEETSGTPGVTYEEEDTDYEWTPPVVIVPPPPPVGTGDGFGTVYGMTAEILARTRDFSLSSPAYGAIKSPGAGEDFYDWILDPFAPKTAGLLLTSDGVYLSDNLNLSSPTFSQVLTASDIETMISVNGAIEGYYQIKGTIRAQGFFAFIVGDNNGHTDNSAWCIRTVDYGANWTAHQIYQKTGTNSNVWSAVRGGIEVSPHLSGSGQPLLYAGIGRGHVTEGNRTRVLRSIDGGQNWTQQAETLPINSNGSAAGILDMHVPYHNNADSSIVLISNKSHPTGSGYAKSTDSGANWTNYSAFTDGAAHNRTPHQSWTQNNQELYAFAGSSGSNTEFWRSSNGGTTWARLTEAGTFDARGSGGFPYNGDQFYIIGLNGIWVTTTDGASWVDKTGDWSWGFNYIADCGGVIVPVWVAE